MPDTLQDLRDTRVWLETKATKARLIPDAADYLAELERQIAHIRRLEAVVASQPSGVYIVSHK